MTAEMEMLQDHGAVTLDLGGSVFFLFTSNSREFPWENNLWKRVPFSLLVYLLFGDGIQSNMSAQTWSKISTLVVTNDHIVCLSVVSINSFS